MPFRGRPWMRPRPESQRQRNIREARELEHIPEDLLTDEEKAKLAAYYDYENNAFDRANDR